MANTLFVGRVCRQFDELPSTNDYIRNLVHDPLVPEGFAVRANYQSEGRGQMSTRWVSAPGQNLLLSILLRPTWLSAADHWWLYPTVALGVASAIDSAIKWPNDLYFGQRKTGGILIQNVLSGEHLAASVVGIGLNVNQTDFDQLAPNATSVGLHTGEVHDIDAICSKLFQQIEGFYLQLKAGQRSAILDAYYQRLTGYRQSGRFRRLADGQEFEGVIAGVAPDGRLRIATTQGEWVFGLKEVAFLWE